MRITQVLDGRGKCGDCDQPVTEDVTRGRWIHDHRNSDSEWCAQAARRCLYCGTAFGVQSMRRDDGRLAYLCERCHADA